MKENFLSLELSKKLHEKGFTCKHPFAMYNELGHFHALFTSADKNKNIKSIFGCRDYYDYDDFDNKDITAPTIEQALKWLREECKIHVEIDIMKAYPEAKLTYWGYNIVLIDKYEVYHFEWNSNSFEQAAIEGIEYALKNLL